MTVTFLPINNFNLLSKEQAEDILYNELIPCCEKKEIHLSQYGNHNGQGTLSPETEYRTDKLTRSLFTIDRVQRLFSAIPDLFAPASRYTRATSYGLKHAVERIQGEYITNGDLIAAMLMRGFTARFKIYGEMSVNCQFKAKILF